MKFLMRRHALNKSLNSTEDAFCITLETLNSQWWRKDGLGLYEHRQTKELFTPEKNQPIFIIMYYLYVLA